MMVKLPPVVTHDSAKISFSGEIRRDSIAKVHPE
jgi:hypothetical protein